MEPLKSILGRYCSPKMDICADFIGVAAEIIPGPNAKTDADLEAHLKSGLATLFRKLNLLSKYADVVLKSLQIRQVR